MDQRRLSIPALSLCAAAQLLASDAPSQPALAELLGDPTPAQWRELSRFDLALTRRDFESRLDRVFDPGRGLRPYLRLGDDGVEIYGGPAGAGPAAAVVRFAPSRGRRGRPPWNSGRPSSSAAGPPPREALPLRA